MNLFVTFIIPAIAVKETAKIGAQTVKGVEDLGKMSRWPDNPLMCLQTIEVSLNLRDYYRLPHW